MVPAAPRDSPCQSDNTGIGLDPVYRQLAWVSQQGQIPIQVSKELLSVFGLSTLGTGIELFVSGKPAQTGHGHSEQHTSGMHLGVTVPTPGTWVTAQALYGHALRT